MKRINLALTVLAAVGSLCLPATVAKPVPDSVGIKLTAAKPVSALQQVNLSEVQEASAIVVQAPVAAPTQPTTQVSGSCADWLAQAGISITYGTMETINRESGCNPNAINPSSGACGIAQELPCGKSGCGLGNPVCQLEWMQNYVNVRYGGWAGAWQQELSYGWY